MCCTGFSGSRHTQSLKNSVHNNCRAPTFFSCFFRLLLRACADGVARVKTCLDAACLPEYLTSSIGFVSRLVVESLFWCQEAGDYSLAHLAGSPTGSQLQLQIFLSPSWRGGAEAGHSPRPSESHTSDFSRAPSYVASVRASLRNTLQSR